jgi:hypothetical protein
MSSFLEPESSFARSTTAESTETSQSHEKKWRAPIWAYCRRPTPDENQEHLYCPHCPSEPYPDDYEGPYNIKNSTNMAIHLKRHHDITAEKSLSKN